MASFQTAEPIYILSISANDQDHTALAAVLGNSRWVIVPATNCEAASAELKRRNIAVVVCDCDSIPERWTDVLGRVQAMTHPPAVILTSRMADDILWTQALQSGAWDVLIKPFHPADVVRSVRYAWERSRNQQEVRPGLKAMSAAG